ncbi:MAG: Rnf-Nqr domain containing protein, partial [Gammaproteobacteria bacterium]
DGLAHGLGFAWVLVLLGGVRELLGHGTLLRDAEYLFGPGATGWRIDIGDGSTGLLLALLPPGAFIGLGLLVAARNVLHRPRAAPAPQPTPEA